MKLLWLCNMAPGIAQVKKGRGGLWMDHVLEGLRRREDMTIRILFPATPCRQGNVGENCSFASFENGLPYEYLPELENYFGKELAEFQPDVIHIWGTEYAHTLAMVNAAEKAGRLAHLAVSIQGLCSLIARDYANGVPETVQKKSTFRDFVRKDNIKQQQAKFALRGELEVQALQMVRHVIGRTHWDKASTARINPGAAYHFCNETLREPFYEGNWRYNACQKHRVFASSCDYPVKGFHSLLEAFGEVVKTYPDATLAVTGRSFFAPTLKEKLRRSSYQKYLADLAKKYGLQNKIEFLGSLTAQQMKENYLKANAFVLPSTIENSPNSLGEAMLLGVPCVAADVGGVTTMMTHGQDGFVFPSCDVPALIRSIEAVFAMGQEAEAMGAAAKVHAGVTHDPQTNLNTLLSIYESIK